MFEKLLARFRPYSTKGGAKTNFMESKLFFLITIAFALYFDYQNIEPLETQAKNIIGVNNSAELRLIVITILIGLDFLPILLGYFMSARFVKMQRRCKVILVAAILLCMAPYLGQKTTHLEAQSVTSSANSGSKSGLQVDTASQDQLTQKELEEKRKAAENAKKASPYYRWFSYCTEMLITITPLMTSAITFSVSVIRKRGAVIEKIYMLESEIDEQKMVLLSYQKLQPANFQKELEVQYENVLLKIDAENQLMKAEFRKKLLSQCGDAQLCSLVSQIALTPPPSLAELQVRAGMPPQSPPRIPMPSMMQSDAAEPAVPFTDVFVPVEVVNTREVSLREDPDEPVLTLAKRYDVFPESEIV